MCNRFKNDWETERIASRFQAEILDPFGDVREFFPGYLAPGLLLNLDRQRELRPMMFGLCAKATATEPFDKRRPLNNARIESIDRWPWSDAFRKRRCVVPMTSFQEASYWGEETAGTMIDFLRADEDLLLAAGIYSEWRSKQTGTSVITMSLLMRPACEYIDDRGHHRQPLFIEEDSLDAWMNPEPMSTAEALSVLRAIRDEPELTHRHARDMSSSWAKRAPANQAKREEQAAEISARGRVF